MNRHSEGAAPAPTLALALTGAGGAGVISLGELLLAGWAEAGGRGLLRKAFGPQIRGGEAAALLSLRADGQCLPASRYDVLLALDWNNFHRFEDEIRLHEHTLVLCAAGEPPAEVVASGAPLHTLAFAELARAAHPKARPNLIALGVLATLLDIPLPALIALAQNRLGAKVPGYAEAVEAAIRAGAQHGEALAAQAALSLSLPLRPGGEAWCLSGNQAAAYGALAAGVRFVAAYPITPASDVLEAMAVPLEELGGALVQAEDELAAINMALGAAFGGVPAFTATSGPGLALMTEALGLAVASETAVTVLNVMRAGPSTGIPTKSEQSDLNIALHGLHGDAPHLVLAALDVADCAFVLSWAVTLAQQLQAVALVLSDQFLGHSTAVVAPPTLFAASASAPAEPGVAASEAGEGGAAAAPWQRYALTDSGVSPLAVPGEPGRRFTADGLEHNPRGAPSAGERDHRMQLDKRARKLACADYSAHWARISGEGALALVCFGSAACAVTAAAERLTAAAQPCRVIALRLLAPFAQAGWQEAMRGVEQLLVVEQNHGAQLWHYLRGQVDLPARSAVHAVPGPVPLDPQAIAAAAQALTAQDGQESSSTP
jgi:2-oxoglutarate ferredoxin oxidoreductase subunit alpha